jgi:hypothetical protein
MTPGIGAVDPYPPTPQNTDSPVQAGSDRTWEVRQFGAFVHRVTGR